MFVGMNGLWFSLQYLLEDSYLQNNLHVYVIIEIFRFSFITEPTIVCAKLKMMILK